MTMFGGVPISVASPPRIVAKDSGMRLSPGGRLAFFAVWMSTGISSASAATLFMKADITAPIPPRTAMCVPSGLALSMTPRVTIWIAPEFTSPREITSTSAMMTVASWPKPENVVSAGTRPAIAAAISAPNATRS